jgi:hypothetical protein
LTRCLVKRRVPFVLVGLGIAREATWSIHVIQMGAHMRKILAAGIGIVALTAAMQPAAAADMARKAPVYKAPPPIIDP